MAPTVARPFEARAIADFLKAADAEPAGLVIEGDPGIGKTTLWLEAVAQARDSGFHVLSARGGQAEVVLTFAVLADLLRDVEPQIVDELPEMQRIAVDRALLRTVDEGPATDERVLGAAFLQIVERLSADKALLLAIDDFQWLDKSSQTVVAFTTRRLKGRVGILVTVRSDAAGSAAAASLQLNRPDGVRAIRVGPLGLAGLHSLISDRLGRSLSRPTMARITEISGGNPFYALELARATTDVPSTTEPVLPPALAQLIRDRIGRLDDGVRAVLLAAASSAVPTVDLVASACGIPSDRAVELLDSVADEGIVALEGNRVRFGHPLVAAGVYSDALPAQRRAMHRALVDVVAQPELRARHLALAAPNEDEATLRALDEAANTARGRGAPAIAAELVDLAIARGGDTPQRRLRSATHHLRAGDAERARVVIEPAIELMPPGKLRARALNLLAGIRIYDDSFVEAEELLKRALDDAEHDPIVRVQTLPMLSFVQGNMVAVQESLDSAEQAVAEAEALGIPVLTSAALAIDVYVKFMYGLGLDESRLARALDFEDQGVDIPIAFRPSAVNALMLSYLGRLDEAAAQMQAVRHRCLERGAETDMVWVAGHTTLLELWRGNFTEAAQIAEEAVERAQQLGGDQVYVLALTARIAVAAYQGHEDRLRADVSAALDRAERCGSRRLAEWPTTGLGFLEVSQGKYTEALTTLQPLLDTFTTFPDYEIITGSYLPDAIEALVAVGRLDEAEPLIATLERNGIRLDRAWMLALGARGRGMWLAALGEVDAAVEMAEKAMAEHERLPMPFERARTQLLLGQLQRRQRQKQSAVATLREALLAFEDMGTPLWADRARTELARTNVRPTRNLDLTPSELRVAELAASGITNRDIAAKLFVSAKTIEANLTQVYRKLGIHSRAQLGAWLGRTERDL